MNIMHRDIKSANVFMGEDNECQLGDLNVSKILQANGFNFT